MTIQAPKAYLVLPAALFWLLWSSCTPQSEGTEPGECSDLADNDGDGLHDCGDPDCFGSPVCIDGFEGDESGECSDDADNDQDGLFDCAEFGFDDGDCTTCGDGVCDVGEDANACGRSVVCHRHQSWARH